MAEFEDRVVLIAEFTARAGNAETVAALLAELAEQVRREEGNIAFECYRAADNASKFVVYEIYRDRRAFDAHIGAEYGAVFNARLQQLIVEPHSVLTFLQPLQQ
jgi:quinol monooxygenase YgiN